MKSAIEEFYKQVRQFQIENGYLLRMIADGDNVILSEDLKTRLYMTATDDMGALSGDEDENEFQLKQKRDPTFGMTLAQKERYEKKMCAKPRPRDIFNV